MSEGEGRGFIHLSSAAIPACLRWLAHFSGLPLIAYFLNSVPTCCCADTFGVGVPKAPAIVALTLPLYAFCLVFAVNSAIHSYLVVSYAEGDKVCVDVPLCAGQARRCRMGELGRGHATEPQRCRPLLHPCLTLQVAQTVGVYYASNAVGRLVGTLASGALYSYVGNSIVDGFGACLMVSFLFAGISSGVDLFLHDPPAAAAAAPATALELTEKGSGQQKLEQHDADLSKP